MEGRVRTGIHSRTQHLTVSRGTLVIVAVLALLSSSLTTLVQTAPDAAASSTSFSSLDLGTLGGQSIARFVANNGEVYGSSFLSDNAHVHPFRWTATTGMVDLGVLPGTDSCFPQGISASGGVSGYCQLLGPVGPLKAFTWTVASGMRELPRLPGDLNSEVFGENAHGDVVGISLPDRSGGHAVLWPATGGVVDLGALGGGLSFAGAVNDSRQVVGNAEIGPADPSGSQPWHAILATQATGMRDLGTLNGDRSSEARAINRTGLVVGASWQLNGDGHAFVWSDTTGMVAIDTLGGHSGVAIAANDVRQVVGTDFMAGNSSFRAFLWQNGAITDLGTLGGSQSEPRAINGGGKVVGDATTQSNETHAFVWTPSSGITDLNPVAGTTSYAFAVNDGGLIVGSSGQTPSSQRATLWQPQKTLTAVGAASTEQFMDSVLAVDEATNVPAHPTADLSVLGDGSTCTTVSYSSHPAAGAFLAPPNARSALDALRDSVAGTYPDTTTDAGRGCVDIARSDIGPRSLSPNGDNATFEYYGYALDAVTWATSSPNAPPALTQAQLQGIYNCAYTDWSQVGGSPGHITRVLPEDGSGTLELFLTDVLGVASKANLPAGSQSQATGCTPIIQQHENQNLDLYNGSNLTGTNAPYSNAAYAEAIFPYSAGLWNFEAGNSLDPTVDTRAGARVGALLVNQGSTTIAASAVRWTGSSWQLNNTTVVGDATSVHVVSNVSFAAGSPTITAAPASFVASDVGRTIDNRNVFPGATVQSVAGDGSSATVSPAARFSGTSDGALGSPLVSEDTVRAAVTAAPFPGIHYLYNVIDSTEPSYTSARGRVGFDDRINGSKSPLCNGDYRSDILSTGFLPLAPRTSLNGSSGVTCVEQKPVEYAQAVLADSPLASWRLGESQGSTASDQIAPAANGTYVNVALGSPGAIAGSSDTSASFNGSNSYVELGGPPKLTSVPSSGQWTFEAWAYPTDVRTADLIRYGNASGFYVRLNGLTLESLLSLPGNPTDERNGGTLVLNAWNHIVVTYDGATRHHYVNGSLAGTWSEAGPLSFPAGQGNVEVGRWPNDGAHEFFPGRIDEVALYPTALSAAQVLHHYRLGAG